MLANEAEWLIFALKLFRVATERSSIGVLI